MTIIFIGNYKPDKQESMERFTLMLSEGFTNAGMEIKIWRPYVFFGIKSLDPYKGLGKYLGYLDKWLVFPLVLKFRILTKVNKANSVFYHVCDHSNAPYLKYLPKNNSGITCHDVLAIRGALGYADAYCPATKMGQILQKWILKNLSKAHKMACVSHHTMFQLKELSPSASWKNKEWRVIHNAFNAPFYPMLPEEYGTLLKPFGMDKADEFILHVGSSLPRKNRKLLIDMLKKLEGKWHGYVCFAGDVLEKELMDYATHLGLSHRVMSMERPEHTVLVALFSACKAFVFPSLSEGFGWPLIEAQACGAPVIASNLNPMPEVSGGAAIHADPLNPQLFAEAFLKLQNESFRNELIEKGFENIQRFSNEQMIHGYLDLFDLKKQEQS
ncbi:glycosyltransferase family 1 protein [Litoribaculum gwangyangense]|uniref:Glycosyltransferase family 1 protein n=1 Tax=Litoribaculum gwangyangense TaxID=1130722 RepID=A0ABP9CY10_9FLAO